MSMMKWANLKMCRSLPCRFAVVLTIILATIVLYSQTSLNSVTVDRETLVESSKLDFSDEQDSTKELSIRPVNKDMLRTKRLPQALIIGVNKGGTRALLTYLTLHPDIVAPSKEQKFFAEDEVYARGLDYYRQQMPPSFDHQVTLEKTTAYFRTASVPKRINQMNSSIHLILVVRDPITRLISEYVHRKDHSSEETTFPHLYELLLDNDGNINPQYQAVNTSTYYIHYARWLEYFPREQIHVVDGQALIEDPYSEIVKVESFLGIGHKISKDIFYFDEKKGFYCMKFNGKATCLKDSKGRKHPNVDAEVIKKLEDYFKTPNEKFFTLAKRRFDWNQDTS